MLLRLITLLLFSLSSAVAGEILVVSAAQSPHEDLSTKKVEDIFLKKTLVSGAGVRWVPLNLGSEHPVRRAFSQSLFKQLPEDMELYWNDQYFQGNTPPYVVVTEEAMIGFIATTPGAIGYISPCHLDKRVQVIFKLDAPELPKQNCNKD